MDIVHYRSIYLVVGFVEEGLNRLAGVLRHLEDRKREGVDDFVNQVIRREAVGGLFSDDGNEVQRKYLSRSAMALARSGTPMIMPLRRSSAGTSNRWVIRR